MAGVVEGWVVGENVEEVCVKAVLAVPVKVEAVAGVPPERVAPMI